MRIIIVALLLSSCTPKVFNNIVYQNTNITDTVYVYKTKYVAPTVVYRDTCTYK